MEMGGKRKLPKLIVEFKKEVYEKILLELKKLFINLFKRFNFVI